MKEEEINALIKVGQALLALSSQAKNNPAVQYPNTEKEYSEMSESIMNIIRNSYKK